jgi:P-type E1-E2 ATPase
MEALKDVIPDETRVLRGKTIAIATDELVPGDVVLLEAGNRIPADVRFIETHQLKVDESTLTGESNTIKTSEKLPAGEYSLGDYSNLGKALYHKRTRKRLCHGNRYGNGTWSHCTDDSITRFINSITNTISCLR